MALYSIANLTSNVTNANAAIELRTAASDKAYVREIGFTLTAATASTYGLGRPAAIGITPTTPKTLLAQDPSDPAATTQTALAWGTGPTVPTDFFRRISLPAQIGAGVIWTFDKKELGIAVSSGLVLWNLATNGAVNIWFTVEE